MTNSPKRENLLNLALDSTPQEREQSGILNVGVEEATNRWEVIVKYHGNLEQIANDEIQVEILLAGYAIVTLPESMMDALVSLEEVEYVEKPKSLIFGLYEAKENSCLIYGAKGSEELTGKGVLLAVIDSGIDYFLPDFQKGQETRILYLWDQSLAPDERKGWLPPEGFENGVEFTGEQINQALRAGGRQEALQIVPQLDISGHGTGVSAIAASSNTDPLLRGVAPECDLLVVKMKTTSESDFPGTTDLMRGVTYAIRKAIERNQPLVINISFGNSYGSHDGTSLLERFLDNAAEVGRTVICVGCGNEGVNRGHVAGNVKDRTRIELAIAFQEPTINVQLWKSYEDQFAITLISPGGNRYQVVMERNQQRQENVLEETKILIYVGMPTPYSSLQEIFFVFLPLNNYVNAGIWIWQLEEIKVVDGTFQMYLPAGMLRNEDTGFFLPDPNLSMTIPATSSRVISVAAYQDTLDTYADFSGRGRQLGGYIYLASEGSKPDLAAPGVGLLAARRGGGTGSYTGTSFSTPMVAGSAALLMEWGILKGNDPYLYGEKVKAYLRKGARPIRGEYSYPNNKVGWGALCLSDSLPG